MYGNRSFSREIEVYRDAHFFISKFQAAAVRLSRRGVLVGMYIYIPVSIIAVFERGRLARLQSTDGRLVAWLPGCGRLVVPLNLLAALAHLSPTPKRMRRNLMAVPTPSIIRQVWSLSCISHPSCFPP